MDATQISGFIATIASNGALSFQGKGRAIQSEVDSLTLAEVLVHLECAGVIPESFGHDSTEEKLYAKYCDALLARSLRELGFSAYAIDERSDAADVIASVEGYRIVGDAKAFRLSRTAKNQKDFKVEALNNWRKGAEYACLVAPLYQYPNTSSQIYSQAIRYSVTLLSYSHLVFMLQNSTPDMGSIRSLWECPKSLKASKGALDYWAAVDTEMFRLFGCDAAGFEERKKTAARCLQHEATQQIEFWNQEKKRITCLAHDVAVKELIKALKIEAKIATIRRTAGL